MEREGEARRFCEVCTKQVHDLSALTEDEARALLDVEFGKGRVCVRYKTDLDGGIRFSPDPSTVTYASTARAMLAAAGMSLMLMTGCVDTSPDRVEHDRCVHEVGPWTISTARGEGSCPAPEPEIVGKIEAVTVDPPEEPIEMGEIEPIEAPPTVKGEVAPIEDPEPRHVRKGKVAAPVEIEPVVEVMGDIAAPEPCDGETSPPSSPAASPAASPSHD